MDERTTVEIACDAVGGPANLARLLNIKPPSVSEWKARGRIPTERVPEVERVTGISRHVLRPDIFGAGPAKPQKRARAA